MLVYPFKYLEESVRIAVNPQWDATTVLNRLNPEDRQKLDRIKVPAKRDEFLWSRAALIESGVPIEGIRYENGKPLVAQGSLSLSHCKGGVAGCFSTTLEVGIDIETQRPNLERIHSKFTDAKEINRFNTNRQDALQFIWGLKESLFKLYGLGDVDFKEHLNITSFSWDEQRQVGWGTAWITAGQPAGEAPIQTLVQTAKIGKHYLCMATHRKPMEPVDTGRTTLREWTPKDAQHLFDLNTNPAVVRYTGDSGFKDMHSAEDLILTYPNYQRDGFGRWLVVSKETGVPMGWCGLKRNRWGIDLGFRFFERYWNQGFATECAKSCIDIARTMSLDRIVGRALSENKASLAVLEKVGMVRTESHPISHFAEEFNIAQTDLEQWSGQQLHFYSLES